MKCFTFSNHHVTNGIKLHRQGDERFIPLTRKVGGTHFYKVSCTEDDLFRDKLLYIGEQTVITCLVLIVGRQMLIEHHGDSENETRLVSSTEDLDSLYVFHRDDKLVFPVHAYDYDGDEEPTLVIGHTGVTVHYRECRQVPPIFSELVL